MARKSTKRTKASDEKFVCIKGRNVYRYADALARRRDAAVVNGGQAAAVLISRGMTEHSIAKAYEKEAGPYLEGLDFSDGNAPEVVDGESVLENADAVIDTRRGGKAPEPAGDIDELFGDDESGEFGEATA